MATLHEAYGISNTALRDALEESRKALLAAEAALYRAARALEDSGNPQDADVARGTARAAGLAESRVNDVLNS